MPSMGMVLTTCPVNESEKIRQTILEEKLTACVLSISMNESKFLWKGKINSTNEDLLVFKTRKSLLEN